MRPFVQELGELENKILQMGGLVETAIHNSVRILTERDETLMAPIREAEDQINGLDIEIDGHANRLLALYQPVAKDLRFLTSTIKINSDLERMGDLAVNIGHRALGLLNRPAVNLQVDIPHMSRIVESMVRKSLDAFVRRDEELANSVILADDEVDDLKRSATHEVIVAMEQNRVAVASGFDVAFMAHNLERLADHATNIAEDVLFMVKGVDVRHNINNS